MSDDSYPPAWLLRRAVEGVPLTKKHALARAVVREAVERWPEWWGGLEGAPNREAEVYPLELLHEGLKRLGFVRRRGEKLLATKRGRELVDDPPELATWLVAYLGAQYEFADSIVETIVATLQGVGEASFDELTQLASAGVRREGWRDSTGVRPPEHEVMAHVGQILARGRGCGLLTGGWQEPIKLTPIATTALARLRQAELDG